MENENQTEVTNLSNPESESSTDEKKIEENKSDESALPKSQEELDKLIQSAKSKAKFEVLQELKIKNLEEGKNKISEYDNLSNLKNKVEELNEKNVLLKFNIREDSSKDFLTLAKSEINDTTSLEQAAEIVAKKYNNFIKDSTTSQQETSIKPKIGSDKTNFTEESDVEKQMKAVYKKLGLDYNK